MCEGQAIPFTSIKLVDEAGAETAPDQVGHLLIKGDNVTRGYFRNPEANAAAISADGWLRTGDLALWHDGELYVTGRSKEIIFVNGQNYYPHDIEAVLQREPGPSWTTRSQASTWTWTTTCSRWARARSRSSRSTRRSTSCIPARWT
jgi:acyl-CoA synthetase (AMP-forming)/AMP-acid ligase II